jgi:hypothetical protein
MVDKKVTKNGLNNIFKTGRKLSRVEAFKKYHSLSPEAQESANDWINNRFYLETDFPKNEKLDPSNPDHAEYIEEWLKQRDIVMGWDRDWETSKGQDRIPKYFSEKTDTTPQSQIEKNEGIFEQRMNPTEFKQFVNNRILEIYAYTNPTALRTVGRLTYEGRVAENLARKLAGNDIWFKNALETRDGRDALRMLVNRIPITSETQQLRKKIRDSLKPYIDHGVGETVVNRAEFYMVYPQLEIQIKKNLEMEGYVVEKIYMREFTEDTLEIRAQVSRTVTVNMDTFGYRSDPHVDNVRTEKKDINIGGFRYSTGRFLNHSYFSKHGTAQTDWDTQLALGEIAVIAGAGVRSVLSGIGGVLINKKVTGSTLKELGENVTEHSVLRQSTDPALADTIPQIKPPSDTPTIKGIGEPGPPVKGLSETIPPVKGLSETVPPSGSRVRPPEVPQDPHKLTTRKEIRIESNVSSQISKKIENEIGEDLSMKVYSYGLTTKDIDITIKRLKDQGKTTEEIRKQISDELKVFEHIRDTYYYPRYLEEARIKALRENRPLNDNDRLQALGNSNMKTRGEVFAAEGDIKQSIADLEFEKMAKEMDDPKTVIGFHGLQELDRKALEKAQNILKDLGVSITGASFIFLNIKQGKDQIKDQLKIKDKKSLQDSKIREKNVF